MRWIRKSQVEAIASGGLFVLCPSFRQRSPGSLRKPKIPAKPKIVLGNKLESKTPLVGLRIPETLEMLPALSYRARVSLKAGRDVRRCSRNACRWPASASLTYAYAKKVVWIEDLIVAQHPAAYDLCAAHAERLAVPLGWDKEDLRVAPPAVTPIRPEVGTWPRAVETPAPHGLEPGISAS